MYCWREASRCLRTQHWLADMPLAAERWTLSDARTRPTAAAAEDIGMRLPRDWRRGRKPKPVLMIFEDVHWIDPTSLEAVGRTMDRLRTLGVLLIVTYRPEFEPPWIGRPYVTALTLNRLGEREITAMIDRVTGNKALSEEYQTRHH